MVTIEPTTAASLFADPDWNALAAEYAAECRIEGLPPASGRFETYAALEGMGVLHSFAARVDGRLAGFVAMLANKAPHYDVVICVTESFFVAGAQRKTGAGLRLLAAAEDKARELGSPGLLVSAPFGGRLFEVLPRRGYVEANRVFFKLLPQEAA